MKMTKNETKLHGEYDYECIRNSLSTFTVSRVSNQFAMASSQNNQHIELFDSCQVLWGGGGGVIYIIAVSTI